MEGWGTVLHAQTGNENTPSGVAPQTRAGVHQTFGTSVPARGLFIPSDVGPTSINQRELLAAIFGLKTFLPVARQQRIQLLSDSQVALAVIRNWTCKSPRVMAFLRILRRLCEENGISLGLQYIPSVLNIGPTS
jgi:ribonuclease HI